MYIGLNAIKTTATDTQRIKRQVHVSLAEDVHVLALTIKNETNLIGVDDAVEVRVGHAVTGQLEVALHIRLLRVGAVDRVQLVERRLKKGETGKTTGTSMWENQLRAKLKEGDAARSVPAAVGT